MKVNILSCFGKLVPLLDEKIHTHFELFLSLKKKLQSSSAAYFTAIKSNYWLLLLLMESQRNFKVVTKLRCSSSFWHVSCKILLFFAQKELYYQEWNKMRFHKDLRPKAKFHNSWIKAQFISTNFEKIVCQIENVWNVEHYLTDCSESRVQKNIVKYSTTNTSTISAEIT